MIRDGHIHTPYCPHGTKDSFYQYVERAIELGYKEISFTEHAPLPNGFIDTTPSKDSCMDSSQLEAYFADINELKTEYGNTIKINAGLEVDYIEGFEEETKKILDLVGSRLDDSILSVHFLKYDEKYDCLDYSPDQFEAMVKRYGSIHQVYQRYFETVLLSIQSDLGTFKPKRIGHMTLVRKFQKKFPIEDRFNNEMMAILGAVKMYGYELDYNGAGIAKPLCKEPYPPNDIIEKAIQLGIPIIYGSDAHQAKELNQGKQLLFNQ
ncbi:histidinol-phosphatase HisJ [Cytobacillus spongiae]|uniref:histidinol-phosphatase HisJ n=1 Tax=Cytobacillus spongiae TaxID=2901381 RepID=UPI001F39BDF4|nr:histidinol-phosphatase HisJ [Cytobacillus spongiae]UII55192.1 histidinol-phosphatase HisJ [Cytobacillus spongiae]